MSVVDSLIQIKYEELVTRAKECNVAFRNGNPLIPDSMYDLIYKKLLELESEGVVINKTSPTQTLTADLGDADLVIHSSTMYSLSNVYNLEELLKFVNKVKKFSNTPLYVIQPKLDGLAIEINYIDGCLTSAAFSGDGFSGLRIPLDRITTLSGVPAIQSDKTRTTYHGEVVISIENFKQLPEGKYVNERAAATGILRNMKSDNVYLELLDFVVYAKHTDKVSEYYNLKYLEDMKFKTVKDICAVTFFDEQLLDKFNTDLRQGHEYVIDGLVIKCVETDVVERMGFMRKAPAWAKAFKFPPATGFTFLKSIDYKVGKHGDITPVAVVDPVALPCGKTISNVNLHNMNKLRRLKLSLGGSLEVGMRAEVSPTIIHVLPNTLPVIGDLASCPSCSHLLVDDVCTNHDNCSEQLIQAIIFMVSKEVFNLKGYADGIVRGLVNESIERKTYVFDLKRPDEVVDNKVYKLLDDLILSIKTSNFERFALALNVPGLGRSKVKSLLEKSTKNEILSTIKQTKLSKTLIKLRNGN